MDEQKQKTANKVVVDKENKISIDFLMNVVRHGGKMRTGVTIHDGSGNTVLDKDFLIDSAEALVKLRAIGLHHLQFDFAGQGGLWDRLGKPIKSSSKKSSPKKTQTAVPEKKPAGVEAIDLFGNHINFSSHPDEDIPATLAVQSQMSLDLLRGKIAKIEKVRKTAAGKYDKAKKSIKKIILEMQESSGEFDLHLVEETVSDLFDFIVAEESSFSYITREIFSYDDYLYNHSINVCTIGTVVLNKFNQGVKRSRDTLALDPSDNKHTASKVAFYQNDELREISTGFFLHDIGKVLVPKNILNKEGKLTEAEFQVVKTHTLKRGLELLKKNRIFSPVLKSISYLHHAALFEGETRCYPDNIAPKNIPPYVKICKLADIYDAMTSKRCYKNAFNPVGVVADIFHKYAGRDKLLQSILHAFVKSIGIYPPGSIVQLKNSQFVYVLDSAGPIVLPITDSGGKTLAGKPTPLDLGDAEISETNFAIDRHKALLTPIEGYKLLPDFLKEAL
jgi:HD-GYP domain-containing protein (c-di-GMP phosphodiesterase class II)